MKRVGAAHDCSRVTNTQPTMPPRTRRAAARRQQQPGPVQCLGVRAASEQDSHHFVAASLPARTQRAGALLGARNSRAAVEQHGVENSQRSGTAAAVLLHQQQLLLLYCSSSSSSAAPLRRSVPVRAARRGDKTLGGRLAGLRGAAGAGLGRRRGDERPARRRGRGGCGAVGQPQAACVAHQGAAARRARLGRGQGGGPARQATYPHEGWQG
jgi:hypothetical protein